jgi:hypothetical protein
MLDVPGAAPGAGAARGVAVTAQVRYYRVFNQRLISEPLLMDQLREYAGTRTVNQMAALAGLAPADRDPGKLLALLKRYAVPYRASYPPQLIAHQQSEGQREAPKRIAVADAFRLAEIGRARDEAPRVRPFKPGPLEW